MDHAAAQDRTTGTSQTILRRSRPLPAGRAMIGALLVVAAIFGVFAVTASADDTPSTRYVVLAAPVGIGSRLTADDLRLEPMNLPPATASNAFTSVDVVVGAVALAPMTAGELLSPNGVLLADGTSTAPSAVEFSFAIDRDHAVNGELQAGELVDVLATYTDAGEGYTAVVTHAATVTSISDERSDTIAAPGTMVVTLALATDADVLSLTHAKETAAVTLVRTTRAGAEDIPFDRYHPEPDGTAIGSRSTPTVATSSPDASSGGGAR